MAESGASKELGPGPLLSLVDPMEAADTVPDVCGVQPATWPPILATRPEKGLMICCSHKAQASNLQYTSQARAIMKNNLYLLPS